MGNSLSRSILSRCTTACAGPSETSRQETGLTAAFWKCATSALNGTPNASAIQARLETKPETTEPSWPPGCGKKLALVPSRRLAIAASSWTRPIPGRITVKRSVAARRSSQSRKVSTALREPDSGRTMCSVMGSSPISNIRATRRRRAPTGSSAQAAKIAPCLRDDESSDQEYHRERGAEDRQHQRKLVRARGNHGYDGRHHPAEGEPDVP